MININGDALKLLKDFIKYGELYPDKIADAMWYDIDGFKNRLMDLKKQIEGL